MSAGLPIATTQTRGAADYLEEGINALFVEPRDVVGLSAALKRLLEDQPRSESTMGRANRQESQRIRSRGL